MPITGLITNPQPPEHLILYSIIEELLCGIRTGSFSITPNNIVTGYVKPYSEYRFGDLVSGDLVSGDFFISGNFGDLTGNLTGHDVGSSSQQVAYVQKLVASLSIDNISLREKALLDGCNQIKDVKGWNWTFFSYKEDELGNSIQFTGTKVDD